MKKKIILGLILLSLFGINFVSASGLCLGDDRYYHNCDDSKYFDDSNYNNYYSYGKYYPVRDYYKEHYHSKYKKYNTQIKYDDVEEYKRTINYEYEDKYGSQKIKYVINEKTEIEMDYNLPYYILKNLDYSDYKDKEDDSDAKLIPWHYSQYQKYYG